MANSADQPRKRGRYKGEGIMRSQVQHKYKQNKMLVKEKNYKKIKDRYRYLIKKQKMKILSRAEYREKRKLEKLIKK